MKRHMRRLLFATAVAIAALGCVSHAISATSAVAEMASGKVLVTGSFVESDTVDSITLQEDALQYTCTLDSLTSTTLACTCPGLDTYPNAPDASALLMDISFTGLSFVFLTTPPPTALESQTQQTQCERPNR